MRKYIQGIIQEYPHKINMNVVCPWNRKIFENINDKKELEINEAETFHTFVMKCMFLAKRGRLDILTGISYLSTKVLKSYEEYLKKLSRIISYL